MKDTTIFIFESKKQVVYSKHKNNKKKPKMLDFDFKKRYIKGEKNIALIENNKGLLK